jgi:hypothetical protein
LGAAGGGIRKKENEGGNEMKHKAGDTVRIQSREWWEKQDKDNDGDIPGPSGYWFFKNMSQHCGKIAKITKVRDTSYTLDIDNGQDEWDEWMFDPDYHPNEPLSPEDAIRAMLDGETLYDDAGRKYWWQEEDCGFRCLNPCSTFSLLTSDVRALPSLYRRPEKRTRAMTRWEILAWAGSEESRGWVVAEEETEMTWYPPQYFGYELDTKGDGYCRAKLLPDGSGIDETTICGFEVEE